MNRKEVAELLQTIQASYQNKFNVKDPARTLDTWGKVLLKHDLNKVFSNLERHIETNPFPPTLSDLIKEKPMDRMNAIPNAEETRRYLDSFNNRTELTDEQEQQIKIEQQKIRKILGIR